MDFDPADTEACCLCCPLFWGVRMISLVSISIGMFAALSLLSARMPQHIEDQAVKEIIWVRYLWAVFHMVGLFVGYNGILGLRFRQSARVRWLCYYYAVTVCLEVPTFVFYIAMACQMLKAIQASGELKQGERLPTCDEERRHLFVQALFLCAVHLCFAHAAWSLAKYFDRSPLQGVLPLFGEQDAEQGLRAPLLALPGGPPRLAPPREPAHRGFQPFTGRPLRLD